MSIKPALLHTNQNDSVQNIQEQVSKDFGAYLSEKEKEQTMLWHHSLSVLLIVRVVMNDDWHK